MRFYKGTFDNNNIAFVASSRPLTETDVEILIAALGIKSGRPVSGLKKTEIVETMADEDIFSDNFIGLEYITS